MALTFISDTRRTSRLRELLTFAVLWGGLMAIVLFGLLQRHEYSPRQVYWAMQPDRIANLYSWLVAQYRVNYVDYGFVKRGLVGLLFRPFSGWSFVIATVLFNVAIAAGCAAVTARFFDRYRTQMDPVGWALMLAAVLIGSFGFIDFGYEFGLFDYLNFLLLIAAMAALRSDHSWLAAVLCGTALLIHEAFMFYGVPVLAVYALDLAWSKHNRNWRAVLEIAWPLLLVTAVITVLLFLYGRYEPGLAAIKAKLGNQILDDAPPVWTRSLADNLAFVRSEWHRVPPIITPKDIVGDVGFWLILSGLMLRLRRLDPRVGWAVMAPLAILPLYFIGTDYGRWCRTGFITTFIVMAFAIVDGRLKREMLADNWVRLCLLAMIGLPLVAFGTHHIFEGLTDRHF